MTIEEQLGEDRSERYSLNRLRNLFDIVTDDEAIA
jgi:hypothetical protein